MHSDFVSQIRGVVSKKKKRYQKQGFDLDLSYVTDRIIAMGFPADNFEAFYRNHIDDVVRFFDLNHSGHYKIYNLCRERAFDSSKFSGEIVRYPFDDHNPPGFSTLEACIRDISDYLSQDPKNVVGINCKAGKGRTGVIVCCSLLISRVCGNAYEAMIEYAKNRTQDRKGVTIPSQIRYIHYYDLSINDLSEFKYEPKAVWLRFIEVTMPNLMNNSDLSFAILTETGSQIFKSNPVRIHKSANGSHSALVLFQENIDFPLYGDLKIKFSYRTRLTGSKTLCHCWLNTFFLFHHKLVASKLTEGQTRHQTYMSTNQNNLMSRTPGRRNQIKTPGSSMTSITSSITGSDDSDVESLTDEFSNSISSARYQKFKPQFMSKQLSPIADYRNRFTNNNCSGSMFGNPARNKSNRMSRSLGDNLNLIASNEDVNEAISDQSSKSCVRVVLKKFEIDAAHKDKNCKIFPKDFQIAFIFAIKDPSHQLSSSAFSFAPLTKETTDSQDSDDYEESLIDQMQQIWTANSLFYTQT